MPFPTLVSEGNLIPANLLEQIAAGTFTGQQTTDFGFEKNSRLTDEIAAAWADARAFWQTFQRYLRRLSHTDTATSHTREHWILPLLESLGYKDVTYMPQATIVGGRTFEISHRAGLDDTKPPLMITGLRLSLDQRTNNRPRLSPHSLMQEYLNSTEHLWGIVTNGERLRLLRDSSRTSRPTFIEFDLQTMLEGENFSDFALLYRLLHRSRLPQGVTDTHQCLLEEYHQQGLEAGGRVREGLREGVYEALIELGDGFLQHPANNALREDFAKKRLTATVYYQELLRLVYRLIFLMVAEERKLIALPDMQKSLGELSPQFDVTKIARQASIYNLYYSVTRLRRLVEQPGANRNTYSDLWQGLLTTFRVLENEKGARPLGVTALDGDLFGNDAIPHLQTAQLRNDKLVKAMRALSLYYDTTTKSLRRINYAALNIEELGSVYESLLDYRPVVENQPETPTQLTFDLPVGTDRKTTGSYYTPPQLAAQLVQSAVMPVLHARLAEAGRDPLAREKALLDIKICDPACGSGHFLLAAARRLGRELAQIRSGENEPSPESFRRATRDVIAHCIYGVDINPLAIDLCKLTLWLEGHTEGLPLTFLDSHIRCGNSLVGAWGNLVQAGLPDDAFNPVSGDDKSVATAFKKRNKQEREITRTGQLSMFNSTGTDPLEVFAADFSQLDAAPDDSVTEVQAKKKRYYNLREQEYQQRTLYNLWTAAFFTPFLDKTDQSVITSQTLEDLSREQFGAATHGLQAGRANGLAAEAGFFHWELEFPNIFAKEKGGFDVILGNPPWERIKLQEEEHFVDVAYISKASNKAERSRRIEE